MQTLNLKRDADSSVVSTPFVFGVNHESASFAIREKLAFSRDEIPNTLSRLKNSGITTEALILSTCNRTEIYCQTHDIDFVVNAICEIKNICPRTIRKYSYTYSGDACVRQLFRVASGLESMIFGETEIVAQIKDALSLATEHGSVASNLAGLFQIALSVEKEVRSVANVHATSSVGGTLVNIINATFNNLHDARLLFLGAGSMMASILPHFKTVPAGAKTIVNRTLDKAKRLAESIGGDAVALSELPIIFTHERSNVAIASEARQSMFSKYNVIIACCSSGVILNPENVSAMLEQPQKLLIIDLSMPLITDSAMRQHPSITFLTMDDVAKLISQKADECKNNLLLADSIIQDGVRQYQAWLKKREVSPLIRALRSNADEIREAALIQAKRQLQNGENAEVVMQDFSIKLMNKLLHEPTVNLARTENKLQDNLSELVGYLYNL